ncbi:MAG: hypothetical protein ACRCY8_01375 [Dermatophilaceae bacterium]
MTAAASQPTGTLALWHRQRIATGVPHPTGCRSRRVQAVEGTPATT